MASIPASAQKDQSVLGIGASSIRIHFSQEVTPAFRGLVERWARDAADAVLTVYRRFPVSRVTIEVHVTDGARVEGGVTYKGSLIRVNVGSKVLKLMTTATGWGRACRRTSNRWHEDGLVI